MIAVAAAMIVFLHAPLARADSPQPITDCTDDSQLQADAAAGGSYVFDCGSPTTSTLYTITLTKTLSVSKDLTLAAPPPSSHMNVAIEGPCTEQHDPSCYTGDYFGLFRITGGSTTLSNLQLDNGVVVAAAGTTGSQNGTAGGAAAPGGGSIFIGSGANVTLLGDIIEGGEAIGGNGGNGVDHSANRTPGNGGSGGAGGDAQGGAIYVSKGATLVVGGGTYLGGDGAMSGTGGGGGSVDLDDIYTPPYNAGNGGAGGNAEGGAIYDAGTVQLTGNSTFQEDFATSAGGAGGWANGGTVGRGGNGGTAEGGAIYNAGTLDIACQPTYGSGAGAAYDNSVTSTGGAGGDGDPDFNGANGTTSGANLFGPSTIVDGGTDCSTPQVSISDPTVIEPATGDTGEADFTVSLSAVSSSPVSVTVSTKDGTATAPADYKQTTQTITFPAGSTTPQTFKVPVVGGAFTAGKLTFEADLSSPQNATIGTGSADATLVAVSVSAIAQPCTSGPCPSLTDGAARGGTAIAVMGQGFTGAQSVEFVPQDGAPAVTVPADVVSDTRIDVTTPDLSSAVASIGPGHAADSDLPVDVVVEVPDGHGGLVESAKTSADQFTFHIPVVSGVSPARGVAGGGNTLTITGRYFTGADNISLITADNSATANIPLPAGAVQSDTTITLKMPDLTQTSLAAALVQTIPSAGNPAPQPLSLDLAVLVPATDKPSYLELTSLPDLNAYTVEPFAITSVSPGDVSLGAPGTVTIKGVGFVQATDAVSGGSGNQQIVFQPQPGGLGFCYATSSQGPCTVTPTVVSDTTMTVRVPSYVQSSWFTQGGGAPLPLDLRLSATIDGTTTLTPASAADVLTVHMPQIESVRTPPACRPGSIVTLVGQYLDGVTDIELTGTGEGGTPVQADGTTQYVFPITANPSGFAASFDLPSIAQEASRQGGHLVVDVIPEINAGHGLYVHAPANPSDKLTWDNHSGSPCGPTAASASTPGTITANAGGTATVATVNCPPGTGSCTVTASITQANPSDEADVASTRRAPVLGKVTIRIRSGHRAKIKLKLKPRALTLLRQRHGLPIILQLRLKPKTGKTVDVRRRITLQLKR